MIDTFLEVLLKNPDDFLKIAETLTRIGIVSRNKEIVQTCHILHKRGKYYICHFKELFALDGVGKSVIEDEDRLRRNGIANLLQQWGLCEVVDAEKHKELTLQRVKIVPFHQKRDYVLKQNYTVGSKKRTI